MWGLAARTIRIRNPRRKTVRTADPTNVEMTIRRVRTAGRTIRIRNPPRTKDRRAVPKESPAENHDRRFPERTDSGGSRCPRREPRRDLGPDAGIPDSPLREDVPANAVAAGPNATATSESRTIPATREHAPSAGSILVSPNEPSPTGTSHRPGGEDVKPLTDRRGGPDHDLERESDHGPDLVPIRLVREPRTASATAAPGQATPDPRSWRAGRRRPVRSWFPRTKRLKAHPSGTTPRRRPGRPSRG